MSLLDLIPDGSPLPFVEFAKYWQCDEQTLLHLGCIEKIQFSVAVNECFLQRISETQREEIFREGTGSFGEHVIDFCLTGFANLLPESIFSILADGATFPLVLEHGGMLYVRILYEETKIKRITSADLFVSREQRADIEKLINIENMNDLSPLYVTVFSAPPWNEKLSHSLALQRLSFLFKMPDAIGQYIKEDALLGYWIGYIEPVADFRELIIKEVVVHPDFQRKGIGSKLMQSAEKHALEKNCGKVSLSTFRNTIAYDFYKYLGYDDLTKIAFMSRQLI